MQHVSIQLTRHTQKERSRVTTRFYPTIALAFSTQNSYSSSKANFLDHRHTHEFSLGQRLVNPAFPVLPPPKRQSVQSSGGPARGRSSSKAAQVGNTRPKPSGIHHPAVGPDREPVGTVGPLIGANGKRQGTRINLTAQLTNRHGRTTSSLLARDRFTDPQTGVAPGVTRGRNVRSKCRCSMCPAIHITSRSWLRSSSTHEPSDPPLGVVFFVYVLLERDFHPTLYGLGCLFGQFCFFQLSFEKMGRGRGDQLLCQQPSA